MGDFPTSREDEFGWVSWAKKKMTKPLRVLEENADVIGEIGVAQVRQRIQEMGRVADPHQDRDGPQSMEDGVAAEKTGSAVDGQVNIKVGWNLSEYRHGYPELQDRGFTGSNGEPIVGMEALSLARIAMVSAALRAMNRDR